MVMIVIAVITIYPISKKIIRQYARVIWTKCILFSVGAKLDISGIRTNLLELNNTIIVSNHISWLDTVVMLRLCFVQYIGKIEMLNWPILRNIIKAGGTIFIDRKNKRNLISVNQQVAKLLKNGATIGLFPEGKTGCGRKIMPFKAGILEAGIIAKSTVLPIVLSYYKEDDQRAFEVSFAKTDWLIATIRILKLRQLTINVHILPKVNCADFNNREELVNFLHKRISAHYYSN